MRNLTVSVCITMYTRSEKKYCPMSDLHPSPPPLEAGSFCQISPAVVLLDGVQIDLDRQQSWLSKHAYAARSCVASCYRTPTGSQSCFFFARSAHKLTQRCKHEFLSVSMLRAFIGQDPLQSWFLRRTLHLLKNFQKFLQTSS